MRRWLVGWLLAWVLGSAAMAAEPGIYRRELPAPVERVYPAVYQALEAARFWVVFEADILGNIARFKEDWGEDYNRAGLEAARVLVVCNGWFSNRVTGADPDLLALCPLRVGFYQRDGRTVVVFARPTVAAQGSPGLPVVAEVEQQVIGAIDTGLAKVQQEESQ